MSLPKPYYDNGQQVIYHGDCRDLLPLLTHWNLLFTSPPYAQQREYTVGKIDWDALVPPALALPPIGAQQVIVNLGLTHSNGEVNLYWSNLFLAMREVGWRLFGWYVWDQLNGLPGNWNGRLAPSHEFLFHFNAQSVPVNKTVRAKQFGRSQPGRVGLRKADGTVGGWSGDETVSEWKVPDSVIRIDRECDRSGPEREHPARFPVALPKHVIDAYTSSLDTTLDPFMGSGTTLVAAKQLGRKCIGIEISEAYCEIAARRLEDTTPSLFSEAM